MAASSAGLDTALEVLLARLQVLPPAPAATAADSLAVTLPALAAELAWLNSEKRPAVASYVPRLSSSLKSLLAYDATEKRKLYMLALECARFVVEWIVLRELAPSEGKGEGWEGTRDVWEQCLLDLLVELQMHLERTEERELSGSTKKDQAYRVDFASIVHPTLAKLITPSAADGWSEEVRKRVPDLSRYMALDVFSDALSKNAANKALARQLLPASVLGSMLHDSTDAHVSDAVMEIAFRIVPPFSRDNPGADDPKRKWTEELFQPRHFGTDHESCRDQFMALTGVTYYQEMPEILKNISLARIERNQPFIAASLTYNGRPLITSDHEGVVWICQRSILAVITPLEDDESQIDERFHLPFSHIVHMSMENSLEGDEGFITVDVLLSKPPHLGNALMRDARLPGEKHHRLVLKTTNKGLALNGLKKTMEARAWSFPELTPHPTSSGGTTTTKPTILVLPPHSLSNSNNKEEPKPAPSSNSYRRASQAPPIVGHHPPSSPAKPNETVNGDLETPDGVAPVRETQTRTQRRGEQLATMALVEELERETEAGSVDGGEAEGEEEEEKEEKRPFQLVGRGKGKEREVEVPVPAEAMDVEVDPGAESSGLSSIDSSDEEEEEVKVISRAPSKAPSSRKSTTTSTRSPAPKPKRAAPAPTRPAPTRRSQRLSPLGQGRELTESIDEESTDKARQVEAVAAGAKSMPAARAKKVEGAPRPRSAGPKAGGKQGIEQKEKEREEQEAEPPLVPVMQTKRARSPSPDTVSLIDTQPPRPRTKTTIVDAPPYPKRRKITDASPVDSQAPYQTSLEVEEGKKSSARKSTLEERTIKRTPGKKYGRERKERKVAEGRKVGGRGRAANDGEGGVEGEGEGEGEEGSEEEIGVQKKGAGKGVKTDKTTTAAVHVDYDSLPHVTTKTTVKNRLKPKDLKAKAEDSAPVSAASTTKSTTSRASRKAPKEHVEEVPAPRKLAASRKQVSPAAPKRDEGRGAGSMGKVQTFSQLVATPPATPPRSPARRPRLSPEPEPELEAEKIDDEIGRFSVEPLPDSFFQQDAEVPVAINEQSTGSPPLDPALDVHFVDKAMGEHTEDAGGPVAVAEAGKGPAKLRSPRREKMKDDAAFEDEDEVQQQEQVASKLHLESMDVTAGRGAQPQLQEGSDDDGRAQLGDEDDDDGAGQDKAESAAPPPLRLGDHILGPTPAQPFFDEQQAEASEEELFGQPVVRRDARDKAEYQEHVIGSGDEMAIDGVGEDSGFFAAEDEEEEVEVRVQAPAGRQEGKKQAAAAPAELVPNTSSQPQPSYEPRARPQAPPMLVPAARVSPRKAHSSPLFANNPKLAPPSKRKIVPRVALLAGRQRQTVFSPVWSAVKAPPLPQQQQPLRPHRRASSEPPVPAAERYTARAGGRQSEPVGRSSKIKKGERGRSRVRSTSRGRRQAGEDDEDEDVQILREQLGELSEYVVQQFAARRCAQAEALEVAKRRIEKKARKLAGSMHEQTIAVVEGASELVEQAKSSVARLAELRDRSKQSSKELKEMLAAL